MRHIVKFTFFTLSILVCCMPSTILYSCGGGNDDKNSKADTIINLTYDTPVINEATKKYSFNASCELKSGKDPKGVKYQLTVKGDSTIIALNDDGRFKEIDGLPKDEIYIIKAFVEGNDSIVPAVVEVPGCVLIPKEPRLEKPWLQDEINALPIKESSSPLYGHEMIDGNCKLEFKNIGEDEIVPVGFADIDGKLAFGDWEKVTVDDVEYDSFNRVTRIIMTIVYP